jgi:hypothetical protein
MNDEAIVNKLTGGTLEDFLSEVDAPKKPTPETKTVKMFPWNPTADGTNKDLYEKSMLGNPPFWERTGTPRRITKRMRRTQQQLKTQTEFNNKRSKV